MAARVRRADAEMDAAAFSVLEEREHAFSRILERGGSRRYTDFSAAATAARQRGERDFVKREQRRDALNSARRQDLTHELSGQPEAMRRPGQVEPDPEQPQQRRLGPTASPRVTRRMESSSSEREAGPAPSLCSAYLPRHGYARYRAFGAYSYVVAAADELQQHPHPRATTSWAPARASSPRRAAYTHKTQ